MAQQLKVPKFANEAEEARWWFDNREAVSDEFELAGREGRRGHGTVARRAAEAADSLLPEPEDIALARKQAGERGMEYQAYLKIVVHRALLNEQKSA